MDQLALLTITKYRYRLEFRQGKKISSEENKLLNSLIDRGLIDQPSPESLGKLYETAAEIKNTILRPWLVAWQTMANWAEEVKQ